MALKDSREAGRSRSAKRLATRRRPHEARPAAWRAFIGITGLLVLLIVALVGGIIWFNARKTSDLMLADSERLMIETGEKVADRISLLYDPVYAIVGLGTTASDLTAPLTPEQAISDSHPSRPLMVRALKIYPQILSLYIGFENGDFFMITHLAGRNAPTLRIALHAPPKAEFATEAIRANGDGERIVRWAFLDEDGTLIEKGKPGSAAYDPRQRPWYVAAQKSGNVEHSDLYVFASSGEPGFSLSRRFSNPVRGMIGADVAASEVAQFLSDQRITPSSAAFIFTKSGEAVAVPDETEMAAITKSVQLDATIALPKISDLGNPLLSKVFANYQTARTQTYDVDGRAYVGRVVEIPPRYGRDQLLAVMVPVDEVEKPVIEARNEALLRSILILLLILPLYATLIVGWIDRRLRRRAAR
jgi:adenylate cyclase